MLFALVPMALSGFFLVLAFNDGITFLYGVSALFFMIGAFVSYVVYATWLDDLAQEMAQEGTRCRIERRTA